MISKLGSLEITPNVYDRQGDDYRGLEDKLFKWINLGDMKNRPAPFR